MAGIIIALVSIIFAITILFGICLYAKEDLAEKKKREEEKLNSKKINKNKKKIFIKNL